jgi:hypothetical protein
VSIRSCQDQRRIDEPEEGQESRFVTSSNARELVHSPRIVPITEADPVVVRCATKIDNQSKNQESIADKMTL